MCNVLKSTKNIFDAIKMAVSMCNAYADVIIAVKVAAARAHTLCWEFSMCNTRNRRNIKQSQTITMGKRKEQHCIELGEKKLLLKTHAHPV